MPRRSNSRRPARSTRGGSARWGVTAVIVALLLVGGAGTAYALTRHRLPLSNVVAPAATTSASSTGAAKTGQDTGPAPSPATSPSTKPGPKVTSGPTVSAQCQYVPTSDGSNGHTIPTPSANPKLAARTQVTVTTNYGAIKLELTADAAPCTVNSFLTLADRGFFTGTQCHRLTTDGLYVLQCGDPSATGQGGPGYQFDDEHLPTNAKPAYPRGTLAMANVGPGTNGSQFFLVYKDSQIDPNYSVFGRITAGLDVLDKIAALGTDNAFGAGDGHPKQEVRISRVG